MVIPSPFLYYIFALFVDKIKRIDPAVEITDISTKLQTNESLYLENARRFAVHQQGQEISNY